MNKEYEIVKFKDDKIELDVNIDPKEETIWMNQNEIGTLFQKSKATINEHIKNIFNSKELEEKSVVRNFRTTALDGKKYNVKYYNLDMIISIGYRVNSKRGIQFRKWCNSILKEYMLRGYVINEDRTLVTNENYINLINKVENMDNRIINIENKINSQELPLEKIFYNGEVYDAFLFIQNIFKKAISEIIIIDNYVDNTVLERLKYKEKNVNVIIYTNPTTSKLVGPAINLFNKQYFNLTINYTTKAHDRFIIIDQNELYHLGASIKDAGKKVFGINKMDSTLITFLLNNL